MMDADTRVDLPGRSWAAAFFVGSSFWYSDGFAAHAPVSPQSYVQSVQTHLMVASKDKS